jgi:hypothetical protein
MTTIAHSEQSFWETVFPGIAARAVDKHQELKGGLAAYVAEFRKFLGLLHTSSGPVAMVSPRIDHLWHELITCTPIYRDYCSRFAGRYLDHMPRSEWYRLPEEAIWNFFDAYEAAYGCLPECWFDGLTGKEVDLLRQRIMPPAFRWSGYIPSDFRLD